VEKGIGLVPTQVVREINEEGISDKLIMTLLQDMEMVDENGENIWEEGEEVGKVEKGLEVMEIMESLPHDILPTTQELTRERQKEGEGDINMADPLMASREGEEGKKG
jgi:hypothetical protein